AHEVVQAGLAAAPHGGELARGDIPAAQAADAGVAAAGKPRILATAVESARHNARIAPGLVEHQFPLGAGSAAVVHAQLEVDALGIGKAHFAVVVGDEVAVADRRDRNIGGLAGAHV